MLLLRRSVAFALALTALACSDSTGPDGPAAARGTLTPLTSETVFAPGSIVAFRGEGFVIPQDSLVASLDGAAVALYRDTSSTNQLVFIVPAATAGAKQLRFPSLGTTAQWSFTIPPFTPIANPTAAVTSLLDELTAGLASVQADDSSAATASLSARLASATTALAGLSAAEKARVAYLVQANRESSDPTTALRLMASVSYANCDVAKADLSLRSTRIGLLVSQTVIGASLIALPTGITQIAGTLILGEAIISNRALIKELPGILSGAFNVCWTQRSLLEIVGLTDASIASSMPSALSLAENNAQPTAFLTGVARQYRVRGTYALDSAAAVRRSSILALANDMRRVFPTAWVDAIVEATNIGTSRTRFEVTAGLSIQNISDARIASTLTSAGDSFGLAFSFVGTVPAAPVSFSYRLVDAARGINVQRTATLESADATFDAALNMIRLIAFGVGSGNDRVAFYVFPGLLPPSGQIRLRWGYRPATDAEIQGIYNAGGSNRQLFDFAKSGQSFSKVIDAANAGVVTVSASDPHLGNVTLVPLSDETRTFQIEYEPGKYSNYIFFAEVEALDETDRVRRFFRGVAVGSGASAGLGSWFFSTGAFFPLP